MSKNSEELVEPDSGEPQPSPYKEGQVQQEDPSMEPEGDA